VNPEFTRENTLRTAAENGRTARMLALNWQWLLNAAKVTCGCSTTVAHKME